VSPGSSRVLMLMVPCWGSTLSATPAVTPVTAAVVRVWGGGRVARAKRRGVARWVGWWIAACCRSSRGLAAGSGAGARGRARSSLCAADSPPCVTKCPFPPAFGRPAPSTRPPAPRPARRTRP
jgi:hypothetical protein